MGYAFPRFYSLHMEYSLSDKTYEVADASSKIVALCRMTVLQPTSRDYCIATHGLMESDSCTSYTWI